MMQSPKFDMSKFLCFKKSKKKGTIENVCSSDNVVHDVVHGINSVHDVHDIHGVHDVHGIHGVHDVHGVHVVEGNGCNGRGRCEYPSGGVYEGEWRNGKNDGHGNPDYVPILYCPVGHRLYMTTTTEVTSEGSCDECGAIINNVAVVRYYRCTGGCDFGYCENCYLGQTIPVSGQNNNTS